LGIGVIRANTDASQKETIDISVGECDDNTNATNH